MEYQGCKKIERIQTISCKDLRPKDFFLNYVSTRTPVSFSDHLLDPQWRVSNKNWTHDYLRMKTSRDMVVKVEYREDSDDHYGKGREKTMTFHQFLAELDKGSYSFYLTTQDLGIDSDGRPHILAAPLNSLTVDFPIQPSLFPTLIPANINLWYGQTKSFSTSGLHHDFHDNLYVMIKGEKKIDLYSPAEAFNMYTSGEIVKVHCNGRINYKGQITRADGADVNTDPALEASRKLKEAADRLQALEAESREGLEEVEDEIDQALEEMLDAECNEDDEFDEDDEDEERDDLGESDFDDDEEENEEEEEEEGNEDNNQHINDAKMEKFLLGKRKRPQLSPESNEESKSDPFTTTSKELPLNFSQVKTSLPKEELQRKYPKYLTAACNKVAVHLKEGEMLYIPAGWFHEVQSLGEKGHMAFNYWFHPPDNYNSKGVIDYKEPYRSSFWKKDFEDRNLV